MTALLRISHTSDRSCTNIFQYSFAKRSVVNDQNPGPRRPSIRTDRVIRSRRRTIALEITHDATLVVRAPLRTPEADIAEMIRAKQAWINRKLDEMRKRPQPVRHDYTEGELFLFLGGPYPLTVVDDGSGVIRRLDRLYVPHGRMPGIRNHLKRWYMDEARLIVKERCAYYSMVSGYVPTSIRITDARRRWGSCTPAGVVNFSWRLVQAPLPIVDYVVVHELVHLRQPDHSKKFWEKVSALMPDYSWRRKWLFENEGLLKI